MDSLLTKTAIRWILISFGGSLLLGLLSYAGGELLGGIAGGVTSVIFTTFGFLWGIIVYVLAILDFSKKRNHLAKAGEIFKLTAIIYAIPLLLGLVAFMIMAFFVG